MRRSSPLALLLVACGGTEAPAPLPPDPIYEARPLVRPTGSADITLEQQGVALPVELQGQRLHVAALSGVGTLVGGEGGLYQLTTEGLELVDATPVVGLAAFEDRIVVAHATDLAVWHGTLEPSSINETLSGRTLSALYSDGADLWLGTDLGLDRIRAGRLERFMAMPSPRALGRFQGGQHLIVTEAGGAISALRETTAGVEQQVLTSESSLLAVAPGAGDRLYAVEGGALLERQAVPGDLVRYRPIALTPTAEAGATSITGLVVDPSTGFVWAIGPVLARLENGRTSLVVPPAELGVPTTITVTTDGALWLGDGARLVRIGNQGPPVTWAEIEPFHQANCQRCHAPLGTGHPLETYEVWSTEIDAIVTAVEAGRMPQDGRALTGGTVELLRRWRADGLRR
ncbi:MAG: hypothetical protein IPG45_16810 [Deltaproteobacteria bacterium]|nr:hypothetical protein [Deltaproteobacteria bacterium]